MTKDNGPCPRCKHKGISFTSATDGRAKMVCGQCSYEWTNGQKPGEGYERFKRIKASVTAQTTIREK